nr:MAG TPA: hypothetical protein [Caudoviricetes sp.]
MAELKKSPKGLFYLLILISILQQTSEPPA